MNAEVTVGLGYALFLWATAWCLEQVGRAAYRRAERFHADGFQYRDDIDAFECPGGEHLPLVEVDPDLGLHRYATSEFQCKGCPVKDRCTDGSGRRQILRSNRDWIQTEIGRFHRGLSLALMVLTTIVLAGVLLLFRHPWLEVSLLAALLSLAICRCAAAVADLRRLDAPSTTTR